MEVYLTLSSFLHLVACIFGLLVAAILLTYPGKKPYPYRKLLSGFFGTLAIGLGFGFVIETRLILLFPHIYRMGNIFALLFMPFSYLYFRSVIKQHPPNWKDLIHGLPALFYIIDYVPFYFLPAAEKIAAFPQNAHDVLFVVSFSEGWITPPFFHLILRSLQFAFYWFLQAWLMSRLLQLKDRKLFFKENRKWLTFATILLSLQFFIFSPILLVLTFGTQGDFWVASHISAALVMVFSTFVLFFRPDMLYGIHGIIQYPKKGTSPDDSEGPSYLDQQAVERILGNLEELMDIQQPFLNPGYSLGDLSRDLAIPAYKLTILLNKEVGLNFNDYINRYRIRYCREKMGTGEWDILSIQGMAQECGFNNRNSFTIAFKKFTRKTPSDFLRELEV